MADLHFDGFTELKLTGMCLDEQGRLVPRDDYETHLEICEHLREEQIRRRTVPVVMLTLAYGMLASLVILWAGGRL